jgi:hypothetical protein
MATRRIGPGRADHGAQFFTAREPAFQTMVDGWLAEGIVSVWGHGWSSGSQEGDAANGHPRYMAEGGMNALTKRLAAELSGVQVNTRVEAISRVGDGWQVTAGGDSWRGQGLLLTAPVPQSLALVSTVTLHEGDRAALERISYGPCLCGLFWVEGPLRLPEPGAVQRPDADFSWLADNQAKGISPAAQIVTVHASPAWSAARFDDPNEQAVLDALFAPLEPFSEGPLTVHERQLKKWRYSVPQATHDERVLLAQGLPPLGFAGDAFGGPRVEGAVLSGLAAAEALSAAL